MTPDTASDTSLPDQQEQAATLLAEGKLADHEIAASIGVSRASISRWKRRPAFQARVKALQERINEAVLTSVIANRQARVDALNDRWERMKRVIDERAADPDMATVPGGTTGLIVRTWKQIGAGEDAQLLPEYSVDTPLLKELRGTEQQAAQELGQWTEKRDVNTTGSVKVTLKIDRREQKPSGD